MNTVWKGVVLAAALMAAPASAQNGPWMTESASYPQQASLVPATLVVPQGTILTVQLRELLSSDRNAPGDAFLAVLTQPVVSEGWVIGRPGQSVVGRVAVANRAGRNRGVSELAVELTEIVLVDGQQLPIRTALIESYGERENTRDVGAIAVSTGVGGAIGGSLGGGRGAAAGAAIGAVAAIAGVLSTRGEATEVSPDTLLTFRLESPLAVSTVRGQHAYLPVSVTDYERAAEFRIPASEPARETRAVVYDVGWRHWPPRIYRPYVVRPYYAPRYYSRPSRIVIAPRIVIERGNRRHDRDRWDRDRWDRDRHDRDWRDRGRRDGDRRRR